METAKPQAAAAAAKKPPKTPKSIIHQIYREQACYTIEEVEEPPQNGVLCPGLAVPQKGPTLFRCSLQLPGLSPIVSHPCKKKKEAEQSAAHMAVLQLGINSEASSPVDASDELVSRLSYIFSDEFLSSLHPLSGHLKAVLRREGNLSGLLPLYVLIACDAKVGSLCKSIDARVESDPFLYVTILKKAAVRLSDSIVMSEDELWIKRKKPYPSDIISSVVNQRSDMTNEAGVEAVYIPFSLDEEVVSLSINLCPEEYYLDVIAQHLGVVDASKVLISRTIGKASSEMRLYFSALEGKNLSADSSSVDSSFNVHASYLLGQHIYGNVVLASVGYTWRGADLYHEDVSSKSYFRMLIGKTPVGLFKLSRDAILVADLPMAYTTKTNWRGSLPRDLLYAFCRQHRLSEPVFTLVSIPQKSDIDSPESCTKLTGGTNTEVKSIDGGALATDGQMSLDVEAFRCEIKVLAKNQDLILECFPVECFKKQRDAEQNASLRVLMWFNLYFKQQHLSVERLSLSGVTPNVKCLLTFIPKEFVPCHLINVQLQTDLTEGRKRDRNHVDSQTDMSCLINKELSVEGTLSGSSASNGSLVSISYTVFLVSEETEIREMLERSDEFEFEIGTGAVISFIEAAVLQMTVGQSICCYNDLPPKELVFAAALDYQNVLPLVSSKSCRLEYIISLLQVTEPYEDRMEQALFSPPLSKQRLEFALQHIKEFSATKLIDFGCGSGSLLESLVAIPSSLEKIVGVDLSQKGLVRAAKVLNSKLEKLVMMPTSRLKSVILYKGSITVFDSRLFEFDIGTCLEVIEHMPEEEASLFGDIALGLFRPKLLIVSTPNYEYNVILQKSHLASQEDGQDEGAEAQSCKFRNHDHKFEWTREQFQQWASGLALKYNYSVEYGGVGGDGAEPGFASQIAVFRRNDDRCINGSGHSGQVDHHYKTMWEWDAATNAS